MATKKRNKQDELNRTYRNADVGRVGSSLKNQGYSQDNKGNTYYTVGGVKYNAATGKPVRNQPAKTQKPAAKPASVQAAVSSRSSGGSSSPKVAATTSGSSSGSSRPTPPASRPSSNVGPVADGEQYARNKDPKKYNPLMQKTFGYQTGDAPDQRAKREKDSKTTDTAFSGKSIANTTVPSSKDYSGSKVTNNTSTAYGSNSSSLAKNAETLAEKLRKRRTGS